MAVWIGGVRIWTATLSIWRKESVWKYQKQGRTDNSWGPRAIGDHGAPVSLPKLKKSLYKRYQGHLMAPPSDPEFPNGQSAPDQK
ncbi:unnamed protein product, partial [Staurois parvus]